MKLCEIYEIADKFAPKEIGDKMRTALDWYDNSGILIDCGKEITGVVMALDLTFAVGQVDEFLGSGTPRAIVRTGTFGGEIRIEKQVCSGAVQVVRNFEDGGHRFLNGGFGCRFFDNFFLRHQPLG